MSFVWAVIGVAYLREPEVGLKPEGVLLALGCAQYAQGQRVLQCQT